MAGDLSYICSSCDRRVSCEVDDVMDQSEPPKTYPDAIQVPLTYSVNTGFKPVNETMEAGNLERKYTGVFDEHVMTVYNGRQKKKGFSLDKHGFKFIENLKRNLFPFYKSKELKFVFKKLQEDMPSYIMKSFHHCESKSFLCRRHLS